MMELLTRTVSSVTNRFIEALRSFTELFLTQPLCATLSHLGETDLKTLDGGEISGEFMKSTSHMSDHLYAR